MKKADNFDAKQWLVENKITTQSRLNEGKIKNQYVVKDEEESDEYGDFYTIDKQKAFEYLKQFNSKEVSAKQFIKDDEGWGEFEQYLEDVERMSDKQLEKAMREEMSIYFFSEPDELGESKLNEDEDLFTYNNRGQGSGSDSKTQKGTSISVNDIEPEMNVIISYGYDGGQGSGSQGTATLSGKVKSVTSDKVFISIDDAKLNKYTKKYQVMYKRDGKGISKRDITKITTL